MNEPLINILIRNHPGREVLLQRCLDSIAKQTYKKIQVIISLECTKTVASVTMDGLNVDFIGVEKKPALGPFFYNDYCNDLKAAVIDGWFFFLDSDDYLVDEYALENIARDLTGNAWQAVICQMSRDSGKIKPSDELIASKKIESGRIGLPCMIVRAHWKDALRIMPSEDGDYQWIKTLSESVSTKFVKKVVVHSPKRSFGL